MVPVGPRKPRTPDCRDFAGVCCRGKSSELCRKYGMSDATLYKWKAKYGGMTMSELRRLKDLEVENTELKRLLADAMLDNSGLKGLLAKNS